MIKQRMHGSASILIAVFAKKFYRKITYILMFKYNDIRTYVPVYDRLGWLWSMAVTRNLLLGG